jgi:pseudouridine-5'-phosphate glycosidase
MPGSPAGWLTLAPEVAQALTDRRPVVALESTLIAHGLPYPRNLETALALEETVRAHGAVPATIAVLHGVPRVGLAEGDLTRLARGGAVRKLSRRDLAIAVAQGADGATTVAATTFIAAAAGIAVFATGGIGGVHRGQPFDVSADLPELAETPVVVVCAGAKAILDLPLTLEWLETHGVPVLGYGTDEFPAFYALSSGLPIDGRVDSPAEVVAVVRAQRRMGLRSGVLVAVPAPEGSAMARPVVEAAIEAALADASARELHGKEITPFLLARIAELTEGESLQTNIALLRNNAAVAAEIAAALS